jgi:glycosyltransferase involved in cell wall biosynthesis
MPLRVAWVSPPDVHSVAQRLEGIDASAFHAATWIRNATRALARHTDIELHIVSHEKRFPKDYRFEEGGVHYHYLHAPLPQVPRPVALYQLDRWKYYRELDAIKPDLVHGQGTENLFSYIAVTSGYPAVISVQAIISHLFRQYRRVSRRYFEHAIVQFIERYTIRRARHLIIKAPFVESFVRSLNPDARLYLLENIIHEAFFAVRRELGRQRNRVVFVGTLINTKGVEELVGAFQRVASEFPSLELHLVGTGTHAYVDGVLKPLIASGPAAGRVTLHGQLSSERIAALFGQASMLVLPSYSDTSPNVIAEALVAGVPVIGTDVGGIPYMIEHDRTGLLVPVRDVDSLAAAMRRYLQNEALAEEHARRGSDRARARYGEERFVRSLMEIYAEVLNSASRGGARRS